MDVSVILCTYNRCESLAQALNSIACSVYPTPMEWEVLVVDNNSNDKTASVVETYSARYPGRFRYLFEPRQGKSNALNTGIRESYGTILAFVDDDVTVDPSWLHNLAASLREDRWAGVGGKILPPRGFVPPDWLGLQGPWGQGSVLCAQFDLGEAPLEITGEPPYGTNMAFKRAMFEKYGGFRLDLGNCGSKHIGNEDTEFGRRLMEAGERLCYEPSAIVYHAILEERLHKKYYWSWWFSYGRAKVREEGPKQKILGISRSYFRIPSMAFRSVLPHLIRALLARDPQERFCRQCIACCMAGHMTEIWYGILHGNVAGSISVGARGPAV